MHIKVTVYPEAGEEKVIQTSNLGYEVYTKAAAKRGDANKRVVTLLLELPAFSGRRFRIVGGHTSTHKIIEVT